MKRTYAALHDVEMASATVIYKKDDDPCWYVFTAVVDLDTAVKIADALNREQKALAKETDAGTQHPQHPS